MFSGIWSHDYLTEVYSSLTNLHAISRKNGQILLSLIMYDTKICNLKS